MVPTTISKHMVLVMWLPLSKEECDVIVSILAITNSTHHVHNGMSLIYIYIYIYIYI